MTHDLDSMTRKELEKLQADVGSAIKRATERDRKAVRKAAEMAANKYGFTLAEVFAPTTRGGVKRNGNGKSNYVSVPKYVNPEDSSQTWSGKGRQPEWFKQAMVAGTDPGQMEIQA